ncbi:MAG: hypothetical protein O2946_13380, partial [Planctomycetota bacterium]|nr:hypothetical protein [Planctomycetota bacterium]
MLGNQRGNGSLRKVWLPLFAASLFGISAGVAAPPELLPPVELPVDSVLEAASADLRVAALPPIDFNLEQDTFANEPISDLDPQLSTPAREKKKPYGSNAPVSLGAFWAPPTPVVGQQATLSMNAEFARVGAPLMAPQEGEPLWLGIAKFARLELDTEAVLPDSGERVPSQLWLVETGVTHIRPQDDGGTLGGTFLFGSAS